MKGRGIYNVFPVGDLFLPDHIYIFAEGRKTGPNEARAVRRKPSGFLSKRKKSNKTCCVDNELVAVNFATQN